MMISGLRSLLDYLPLVLVWVCFIYLFGLRFFPEAIADFYDKEQKWVRRATYTTLWVSFFAALFGGGLHILQATEFSMRWRREFFDFFVGMPLMFGSAMAAKSLAAIGDEKRIALELRDRNKRLGRDW